MSIATEPGLSAQTLTKILIIVGLLMVYGCIDDNPCVQADGTIKQMCNGETK